MRAIWKGAVSFGLVNVPVRLYSATENHDVPLHQVRREDGSRIRYRRVAEADGEEVAYRDIAKAYVTEDGQTVILTDEDLAGLPVRSNKEISVDKFVPSEQIDPILFDKAYYLEPDAAGSKAYALLREALRESDRVALVSVAVRSRASLALLRVVEDAITLQTLLWPDEIRGADQLNNLTPDEEPQDKELSMAHMLVESLAGDFDPEEYEDDYAAAVQRLVEAKIEGGDLTEAPEAEDEDDDGVVDLLAALQRSVERAGERRGGSGTPSGGSGTTTKARTTKSRTTKSKGAASSGGSGTSGTKAATRKKSAGADKTGAKKPAAKKSAAGSSTAKKPAKAG